ncbi:MAG: glycosyltransferase [Flavobacteriales bacterium]|nr:glycosyltransferase [Flavobacteriales bacterium]
MRIAYLSTFHPFRGGIAQFNARLLRELEAHGHEVRPYTFTTQYPSVLFPGKTQMVAAGDATDPIHAPRVISTTQPLSWWKAGRAIASTKPDVLLMKYWISFMGPSLGTAAGVVQRHGSKVVTILDNVISHEKRFFDTAFTRYFLARNDGFIAMSEKVRTDLLSLRPDAPVSLAPHPLYDHFGVSLPMAEARARAGIALDRKVLLFFGFIRDYKGLDLLIEALAQLPPDHVLIIAGEPYGDMTKYHDAIDRAGVRDRIVDHIRYIADNEVPLFFSAADLVVLPYRSATQSGITAIAYHFGKPVLATDVGGLREMVEDDRTGIVVQPDAASIANGIRHFFGSDGASRFAGNIEHLRTRLSWAHFAEHLTDFIGTL